MDSLPRTLRSTKLQTTKSQIEFVAPLFVGVSVAITSYVCCETTNNKHKLEGIRMRSLLSAILFYAILATTNQVLASNDGDCADPAVIDAAQYHMACDALDAPVQNENQQIVKNAMSPLAAKTTGCELYGRLYGAKTWTELSQLSDQQIIDAIDGEVVPAMRKQMETWAPRNDAAAAFFQGGRSWALEGAFLSLHSVTSFTPTTVQYDSQQNRYLCRARITHIPNYTARLKRWFFIAWVMQTNGGTYEQAVRQNNTQVWNIIESDAEKVGLAIMLSTGSTARSCDIETRNYMIQTIQSGWFSKHLVTVFPDACQNN